MSRVGYIEVRFSNLQMEVIREEEIYPFEEMINEWAGVFGLYFGVTLLSAVELLNKFITWLYRYTNKTGDQDSNEIIDLEQ